MFTVSDKISDRSNNWTEHTEMAGGRGVPELCFTTTQKVAKSTEKLEINF